MRGRRRRDDPRVDCARGVPGTKESLRRHSGAPLNNGQETEGLPGSCFVGESWSPACGTRLPPRLERTWRERGLAFAEWCGIRTSIPWCAQRRLGPKRKTVSNTWLQLQSLKAEGTCREIKRAPDLDRWLSRVASIPFTTATTGTHNNGPHKRQTL
ncbi:hypothetical protein NDU88_006251 [Pleurodeles waltl]|uniref:Uncharacterized protein n=1 Tax=Pleurodeles waltl TaxID=8319 RepID=A0AAV7PQ46_PLEWA|nr:hypothetical protein NDU88_006251 [Pleurodeles waltl]